MPKPDPTADLAEKLLEALRRLREQGAEHYPTTVGRLAALADPDATPEQVAKALAKKAFADRWVVARKKDPDSPVALAEDGLADSPRLLEYALGLLCSAGKPLHPLPKVAAQVDKPLRAAFLDALERRVDDGDLPPAVGVQAVKDTPHLYLNQFPPPPPKRPAAEELSDRLLRALVAERDRGGEAYPLPLDWLARQADESAKPARVRLAVAREPFRSGAVLAAPRRADSLVALAEDRDELATSDALLEYLLAVTTSVKKPVGSIEGMLAPLADDLRDPFERALRRRLVEQSLPAGIVLLPGTGAPELVLERVLDAGQALALKMVRALEAHGQAEGPAPMTFDQLVREVEPGAPEELVQAARAEKLLKGRVFRVVTGSADGPVALSSDAGRLAVSPRLLPAALAAVRTAENQALAPEDLKRKLHRSLQGPFLDAVQEHLEAGALPPEVGTLRVKRKPLLFLIADVNAAGRPGPTPAPPKPVRGTAGEGVAPAESPAPPAAGEGEEDEEEREEPPLSLEEFARRFDEAFARLDEERGGHNHVSLAALREAVPVDRVTFDAGLQELRRAGRYGLNAAEGRYGLTPEEQEAAIREDGSLLLSVSRKSP